MSENFVFGQPIWVYTSIISLLVNMVFFVNVDAAPLLTASNKMENREHSQGLQMFVQKKRIPSAPNNDDTTDVVKIDARAPDKGGKEEGGKEEGGKEEGGKEGDKGAANTKLSGVNRFGEKTITWPRYKTNDKGDWVANPFDARYDDPYQDTRLFNFWDFDIIAAKHDRIEPKYINYYPYRVTKKAVCDNRSTLYNIPAIRGYLRHDYWDYVIKSWDFHHPLRRKLFKVGNPVECHTNKMNTFTKFCHCQIRRNQRMEFNLPHYPLHHYK